MPADINSMAYTGEVPWHGLGGRVTPGADIDTWLREAGLTWRVLAPTIEFEVNGKRHTHHDKVLVREDTLDVFDTVGRTYTPFQNAQGLNFFREYVEVGDMHIETAGALGKGEVVWALAKMGEHFTLPGGDRVLGYVLISNPHKYGQGATVKFTAVRVVCANTLAMALGDSNSNIQLPHTREFNDTYQQDAKKRLGIARERMHAFQEDAEALVKITLTQEDVTEVLDIIFEDQQKVQEKVLALYSGDGKGATMPSAAGTAWGLLNATTQYFDWHSGRQQETRLKSAWYGGGASKKQAMLTELLGRAPAAA